MTDLHGWVSRDCVMTLQIHIQEDWIRLLEQKPTVLTGGLHGFPQLLQVN